MEISKELKDTVSANPHIKEVHFNERGQHFFNVHKHKKDLYSKMVTEVKEVDGKEGKRMAHVPCAKEENLIVETMSRHEVLGTKEPKTKKEKEGKA